MNQSIKQSHYRVVAGLDFSELGNQAVIEAIRACHGREQPELHVLVVGSDQGGLLRLPGELQNPATQAEADVIAREHVSKLLGAQDAIVQSADLDKVAVYAAPGAPAERLVALAKSIDADLIVLGTHSRDGFSRWILGSVAEEVIRTATCGVLVIRPRDFLNGEKLPNIDPPLKPGEHSLKPFHHQPTIHYVRKTHSSSMMPAI